jgi:hypothetical protein
MYGVVCEASLTAIQAYVVPFLIGYFIWIFLWTWNNYVAIVATRPLGGWLYVTLG